MKKELTIIQRQEISAAIFEGKKSYSELAKEYEVSKTTIVRISKKRKSTYLLMLKTSIKIKKD